MRFFIKGLKFSLILMLLFFSLETGFVEEGEELKKIEEIGPIISKEEDLYFWSISDICCDEEGDLYVADSGWNKIFKFDSEGKFLFSFGREGQGPGEFLGRPLMNPLKIRPGNDGYLYVFDSGIYRISKFTKKGILIKSLDLPMRYDDSGVINSKGEFILINPDINDKTALICLDSNLTKTRAFLEKEIVIRYPYREPNSPRRHINDYNLITLMDKNDNLILVSNLSLSVLILSKDFRIIRQFPIKNTRFLEDFKVRMNKAVEAGGFLYPFNSCLDEKGNIWLLYNNEKNNCDEIYVFTQTGKLLQTLVFPDKKTIRICWINNKGYIFNLLSPEKIGVFKKEANNEY